MTFFRALGFFALGISRSLPLLTVGPEESRGFSAGLRLRLDFFPTDILLSLSDFLEKINGIAINKTADEIDGRGGSDGQHTVDGVGCTVELVTKSIRFIDTSC